MHWRRSFDAPRARNPGKSKAQSNPYRRQLMARSRLEPAPATAISGWIDYRRYRWPDRQIIRGIMLLTKGPTDPNTCIECTSWNAVDELPSLIVTLHRRGIRR
ncbi:MAG: flavodoxin domain-containing protein [Xanthobacteraceae bacterium]